MIFFDFIINFIVIILILSGLFFFFTATLGLLRFPDFYCRLHATGKGDTLGAILILLGIIIYLLKTNPTFYTLLLCIKIIFIILFLLIANPTATHALTRAGLESNENPITLKDLNK